MLLKLQGIPSLLCSSVGHSAESPRQYSGRSQSLVTARHSVPCALSLQWWLQQVPKAEHSAPITSWHVVTLQQGSVHSAWLPQSQVSLPSRTPFPQDGLLTLLKGKLWRQLPWPSWINSFKSFTLQVLQRVGNGIGIDAIMMQLLSRQVQFCLPVIIQN